MVPDLKTIKSDALLKEILLEDVEIQKDGVWNKEGEKLTTISLELLPMMSGRI